jgi:hypothetical protein
MQHHMFVPSVGTVVSELSLGGRSPFEDSSDIMNGTSTSDICIVPMAEPQMHAQGERGRVPRDDTVSHSK